MITIPGHIPIRIYPIFWLLAAFIGWINTGTFMGVIIWIPLIIFSILVHEYGHALTAVAFGQKAEVDLVAMGGLTRRSGGQISFWKEFIIVLNGPLAGFLLFFVCYLIERIFNPSADGLPGYILTVLISINLVWNILNLLPILPLDGGHLLRIFLQGLFGFNGLKISLLISLILSVVAAVFFFVSQLFIAGVVCLMLAFESYQGWMEIKKMVPLDTDPDLQEKINKAESELAGGNSEGALSILLYVREQTKSGMLFVYATELACRILAEKKQLVQAYEWLNEIEDSLDPDYSFLLQQLAFKLEKWEEVMKIGNKAYQKEPAAMIAILNSMAAARLGQIVPAIGWLRCAAQMGENLAKWLHKSDYDNIRDSEEFRKWTQVD